MSMGRRAYDLLRGYVSTEWERIRDVEHQIAEKELRTPPSADFNRSVQTPSAVDNTPTAPTPQDRRERACRILGVAEGCTFDEIRKCFSRLNKRSDPANFPDNSAEQVKAIEIH